MSSQIHYITLKYGLAIRQYWRENDSGNESISLCTSPRGILIQKQIMYKTKLNDNSLYMHKAQDIHDPRWHEIEIFATPSSAWTLNWNLCIFEVWSDIRQILPHVSLLGRFLPKPTIRVVQNASMLLRTHIPKPEWLEKMLVSCVISGKPIVKA